MVPELMMLRIRGSAIADSLTRGIHDLKDANGRVFVTPRVACLRFRDLVTLRLCGFADPRIREFAKL